MMNGFQRMGAIGALLLGVLFVAIMVFNLVLLPTIGLGFIAIGNPDRVLPLADSPLLFLSHLILVVISIATLLAALGVYERLRPLSTTIILATIAALTGATLLLASGMVGIISVPALGDIYRQNQVVAVSAYHAFYNVLEGLRVAGIFAVGWSGLVWGWVGVQKGGLPKPLSYVLMVAGVVNILSFAITALQLFGLPLNVVWSFWLGSVLLRKSAHTSASAGAKG